MKDYANCFRVFELYDRFLDFDAEFPIKKVFWVVYLLRMWYNVI